MLENHRLILGALAVLELSGCVDSPLFKQPAAVPAEGRSPKAAHTNLGEVVWKASPPSKPNPNACSMEQDALVVSEVRLDPRNLFFDLRHQSRTRKQVPLDRTVSATIKLDGCDYKILDDIGWVREGAERPTTSAIRLQDIPDGEIEIILRAGSTWSSMLFQKQGRDVRSQALEQLSSALLVAADPKNGLPAAIAFREPDCAAGNDL